MLFFLISLLLCTGADLPGQALRTEFSGYVLNLPVIQHVDPDATPGLIEGGDSFLDLTRLRLRPVLHLGENTSFRIEYEITALYDSREYASAAPGGYPGRQVTGLRWDITSGRHHRVTQFVDRLYFRHDFPSSTLIAGRQRISWGTGRVWNPTDLFNPIHPASFDKIEKDGADAVSFKHYFGSFTDMELVLNAEDRFREWNAGGRFRTNFLEYDVSVMGGRFDGRGMAGADFAGNFFTTGLRGEVLYIWEDPADPASVMLIAGIDYQFTPEFYCLAEFLYNGRGARGPEGYDLTALGTGKLLQLGRKYVSVNASWLIHPLVTGSLGFNLNLTDESGFFLPQVSWSATSNTDVSLGGLVVFGPGPEYNAYPTSVFGKVTAFF